MRPFHSKSRPGGAWLKQKHGLRTQDRAGAGCTIAEPRAIVDGEHKLLIELGFTVIASGGEDSCNPDPGVVYRGVEAVIDKDLAAERLAAAGADVLMILTDVPGAAVNYGRRI